MSATAGVKRKRMTGPKFYAVRVGHKPGVYHTYEECLKQVKGHSNASFKSFASLTEAENFIEHGLSRKSTPSKYYAVRIGRMPGIYYDWDSASKQVQAFKGAKYKSFSTQTEAERFMKEGSTNLSSSETSKGKKQRKIEAQAPSPGEVDEKVEPGTGPLPAGSEDGFDSRIILNSNTGNVEYKTEQQRKATKMVPVGTAEGQPLRIYTDGSALGNGARGAIAGVGVYFGPRDPRNVSEALTGDRQTNQRAELTALKRAIEMAPRDRDAAIFTDSKYSIDCVTEWFKHWRKNGWLTASKKAVENKDLIESILNKIDERFRLKAKTEFEWVKGHANDPGNVAADQLAVNGARVAKGE
ncbi:MAG: hypothetical protein M1831_006887 [Alyxoria varia]|nr:MAG: hypothetical protein M1831_006887 [Alyxoria varia]